MGKVNLFYMNTLFLEYKILHDQPGLLGDVASLMGLLDINIQTIASIEGQNRGFLLDISDSEKRNKLAETLKSISDLKILNFRKPALEDFLALKHGKKISLRKEKNTYNFCRTELELLLDFMSHYLSRDKEVKIGLKGAPKIGKTETAIAAAVHANKEWRLLSTTLLRKIAVTKLSSEKIDIQTVYIIDAITTFHRSTAEHVRFIKNFLAEVSAPIIIEHPQIFIEETQYEIEIFDVLVELSSENYSSKENDLKKYIQSFNSFDSS